MENNHSINELSTKVYFSIIETEFKSRYSNHTMPFKNRTHKNDTKLLKYIWNLKDQNRDFDINWSIKKKNLLDIVLHQNPVIFASWKSY